jgi:hypothetical protein
MSFDVDKEEFIETFAEILAERGPEGVRDWAWSVYEYAIQERNRTDAHYKSLMFHKDGRIGRFWDTPADEVPPREFYPCPVAEKIRKNVLARERALVLAFAHAELPWRGGGLLVDPDDHAQRVMNSFANALEKRRYLSKEDVDAIPETLDVEVVRLPVGPGDNSGKA